MKAIMKFTVVAAFMLVSFTSMANDLTLYLVVAKNEKSLVFHMDQQTIDGALRLVDMDDNVIYSENIAKESAYNKRFNLTGLENGTYFLRIENPLKTVIYKVNVDEASVKIVDREEKVKPFFKREAGKVYFNFLNLDKEKVNIAVYDTSDRLVFSESVADEPIVERVFNFEKAFKDTYTVVVKNGADTYYERIVVN